MELDGILFDKDGTLFDFRATWDSWAADLISDLSAGDSALAQAIADSIAFDLERPGFMAHSPVIAGTGREAAECVGSVLPDWDLDALEAKMNASAARAPLAPAVPLKPFLGQLSDVGLKLGVMTNDSEESAQAQLTAAGVLQQFDFVAGFDSGYGAKPDPEPLLAFADKLGLSPSRIAMVGDSAHDLVAGRRAGMRTIGVLTGIAVERDLNELADIVLPDIGHIPHILRK